MPDESGRTLRALIVDDEAPARARLRRLLAGSPEAVVVGEAADGRAAAESIRTLAPDVVLLDVQMPGLTGFGVIEEIGADQMPAVIFVTAYDEHALRAFEVQAIDYLLKPVAPERLREALRRVGVRVVAEQGREETAVAARLAELVETIAPPRFLRRILVHHEEKAFLLPVERLDRVQADRNYVWLHAGGKSYQHRTAIGAIADRLDPERFLRINRSEIVRLDAIRELQPWSHGDYRVVLHDGTTLMWSRRYRARAEGEFGAS